MRARVKEGHVYGFGTSGAPAGSVVDVDASELAACAHCLERLGAEPIPEPAPAEKSAVPAEKPKAAAKKKG